MRDITNRQIQVGDLIVYPGRGGSSLWLNVAKVESIFDTKLKARLPSGSPARGVFTGRLVNIKASTSKVIILEALT